MAVSTNNKPENQIRSEKVEQKSESAALSTKSASAVAAKERASVFGEKNSAALSALFSKQHDDSRGHEIGTPRTIRDRNTQALLRHRHDKHHEHHGERHIGGETEEQELRQQLGWRANQGKIQANSKTGQVANTVESREGETAWTERDRVPGSKRSDRIKNPLVSPTVAGDGQQDLEAAVERFSPDDPSAQDRTAGTNSNAAITQTTGVTEGPVPLEQIVGPEAVITFRERLQQVWVEIDEGASTQLDVLARMPINLLGQSAAELLMVESPQGIHFVAFLRNKNDFEILATFDRKELVPENPSRQLIEAAIVAYEQLDTIFSEGCEKIGESVADLAKTRSGEDPALIELRMLWTQAKKRKRKFQRWIDHMVDELDVIDAEVAEAEARFGTAEEEAVAEGETIDEKILEGISETEANQDAEVTQNSDGSVHFDQHIISE